MSERVDDSVLQAAIERGEIIGGALDRRTGRIVPVEFVRILRDDEHGYTLGEYRALDKAVLAMLAEVDAGGQTLRWELTNAAAEAGYAENEVMYSGSGVLRHWDTSGQRSEHPAPDQCGGHQHQVAVGPGESFMFVSDEPPADPGAAQRVGMRVLSFCTVLFHPSYEQAIEVP